MSKPVTTPKLLLVVFVAVPAVTITLALLVLAFERLTA